MVTKKQARGRSLTRLVLLPFSSKLMSKNLRKALVALLLVLVILFVVLGIVMAPLPPSDPLPNPNGYDDFVRAGKMIAGRLDDASQLDQEDLRALIQTNAEPLRLARLGLTRAAAVPIDAMIANFFNIMSDLMALKQLAILLSTEGRLKELDNQPGDAARCYAETVHLGSAMSHGGFLINRLVGIACEGIGASRLIKLVPNLSCEQSHLLVLRLEEIDTNTVTWEEVLRNEKRFARAAMRQTSNPLELVSGLAQLAWSRVQGRSMDQKTKVKHDFAAARLRLLAVELALRCYRGEHGSPRHLWISLCRNTSAGCPLTRSVIIRSSIERRAQTGSCTASALTAWMTEANLSFAAQRTKEAAPRSPQAICATIHVGKAEKKSR